MPDVVKKDRRLRLDKALLKVVIFLTLYRQLSEFAQFLLEFVGFLSIYFVHHGSRFSSVSTETYSPSGTSAGAWQS
jgi:hypothetical protein